MKERGREEGREEGRNKRKVRKKREERKKKERKKEREREREGEKERKKALLSFPQPSALYVYHKVCVGKEGGEGSRCYLLFWAPKLKRRKRMVGMRNQSLKSMAQYFKYLNSQPHTPKLN